MARTWHKGLKYWVRPDFENRIKDGAIAARLKARVTRHHAPGPSTILRGDGIEESLPAEAVFLLTGYHSDTTLLAHAGVSFDRVEAGAGPRCRDVRDQRSRVST